MFDTIHGYRSVLFAIGILLLPTDVLCQNTLNKDLDLLYYSSILNIDRVKCDTTFEKNVVLLNNKIKIHGVCKNQTICHIGVKLFPNTVQSNCDNVIERFIERKLLVYLIRNSTPDSISRDLLFNDEMLIYDNIPFGEKGFKDFSLALNLLNGKSSVKVFSDSARIMAQFKFGNDFLFFSFHRNFNLISGNDKIDADNILFEELKKYQWLNGMGRNSSINTLYTDAKHEFDSIYSFNHGEYYHILKGTYYTSYDGRNYSTLYNPKFPVLSFISTVLHPDLNSPKINVVINHKQYNKDQRIIIPLENLIEFLSNKNELFWGMEDTTSTLSGTLLAYNKELNYVHLLFFSTTRINFFGSKPELNCKMYTYIHTDNVSELFGTESNKRNNNLPDKINVKY